MNPFIEGEEGAVTADWVVVTASLVGLALAVSAVVSNGLASQSGDLERTLRGTDRIRTSFGAAAASVVRATEGFFEDARVAVGERFADLDNASAFSFAMDVSLRAGDEGILFEAGGSGRGTILYQHGGTLYLQAGDGGGYGAASDRGEAIWTVADGDYTIEGSLDADVGLALYVDGTRVSQSSFSNSRLTGGNDGAVGVGHSSVAANRGGFTQGSSGHPGAGELVVYMDQTTGGEVGG